jgi:hypothetical protein
MHYNFWIAQPAFMVPSIRAGSSFFLLTHLVLSTNLPIIGFDPGRRVCLGVFRPRLTRIIPVAALFVIACQLILKPAETSLPFEQA